jgi:hypothetical protein
MDFSRLETAIVDRLKVVPELSRSRVQAWPDKANLEGIVIADSSVFVRFSDLTLDTQESKNRRASLQSGVISIQIQWLTKNLRTNGAHAFLPIIHKAINRWPAPEERIIDPPLYIDPMGFQLVGYELISKDESLWRWGAEYVASVLLQGD